MLCTLARAENTNNVVLQVWILCSYYRVQAMYPWLGLPFHVTAGWNIVSIAYTPATRSIPDVFWSGCTRSGWIYPGFGEGLGLRALRGWGHGLRLRLVHDGGRYWGKRCRNIVINDADPFNLYTKQNAASSACDGYKHEYHNIFLEIPLSWSFCSLSPRKLFDIGI